MKSHAACAFVLSLPVLLGIRCASPAALAPPASYATPSEAAQAYERALAENPTDAKTHMWLGMLLTQEGRRSEGMGHLAQATTLDPALTEAFVRLGTELEADGRFPEALDLYSRAVQENGVIRQLLDHKGSLEHRRETALARLAAAEALVMQGKPDEGLDLIQSLSSELPGDASVHLVTSRAAMAVGRARLGYDERKEALVQARTAALEAALIEASPGAEALRASADSLLREDEEQVASAREKVEAGGATFMREVCVSQKAPMLSVTNRRSYDLTLDLRFANDTTQWVVVSDQVALRSGPGREADRIGLLPRGTTVWVRRYGPDDYVEVITVAGEGWIAGNLLESSRFVSFGIRAGTTLRVLLNPGTAEYRLGRGMRSLAEGTEDFIPYLCYSWE